MLGSLLQYNKLDLIGKGQFGSVYKGYDKSEDNNVAIKQIEVDDDFENLNSSSLREIFILKELRHENVERRTVNFGTSITIGMTRRIQCEHLLQKCL